MKKIFIAILLIAAAQTTIAQKVAVGLKAGLNISHFTDAIAGVEEEALIGFHAGGFFNFALGNLSIYSLNCWFPQQERR